MTGSHPQHRLFGQAKSLVDDRCDALDAGVQMAVTMAVTATAVLVLLL